MSLLFCVADGFTPRVTQEMDVISGLNVEVQVNLDYK